MSAEIKKGIRCAKPYCPIIPSEVACRAVALCESQEESLTFLTPGLRENYASQFPATDEQRLQATAIVPRITKIREAPANRKSWAVHAADQNVVAKIPDRGLTCGAMSST